MNIRSVKNDPVDNSYCIRYLTEQNGYQAELTVDCNEPPRPEFDNAIATMAADFCSLACLEPTQDAKGRDPMSRVRVSSIVKNVGQKATTYSFTAKIFNPTTCKYQTVALPAVDDAFIPADIMEHIYTLFHEAELYVEGKRAQGDLFEDKDEKLKAVG
jgi:hypothetical protein